MTVDEDKEKGWFLIEDIEVKDLKDKEIVFNALELKEWFDNFDRWWLQIKGDQACISHEGFSYEPYLFGRIRIKR